MLSFFKYINSNILMNKKINSIDNKIALKKNMLVYLEKI